MLPRHLILAIACVSTTSFAAENATTKSIQRLPPNVTPMTEQQLGNVYGQSTLFDSFIRVNEPENIGRVKGIIEDLVGPVDLPNVVTRRLTYGNANFDSDQPPVTVSVSFNDNTTVAFNLPNHIEELFYELFIGEDLSRDPLLELNFEDIRWFGEIRIREN